MLERMISSVFEWLSTAVITSAYAEGAPVAAPAPVLACCCSLLCSACCSAAGGAAATASCAACCLLLLLLLGGLVVWRIVTLNQR